MKTFLIDYRRPDGREDFKVVEAATAAQAVEIFRAAGCDGWSNFVDEETARRLLRLNDADRPAL